MKIFQNSFIKHLSLSLFLPLIRFSYGFLLAAMLSKSLSVEVYGEWSLFISMIGLVLTFSSLSLMYSSQVIFPTKDHEDLIIDFNNITIFKVFFTLFLGILFVIYNLYSHLFSSGISLLFLIFLFFRTFADLTFGLLRALLKVKQQVLFLFVESFLILLFVYVTISYIDKSVQSAILAFLSAEVIASIYGYILLKDYFRFIRFDFKVLKPYLAIGIPLVPFAFMDLIINAMTPLFIKMYSTIEMVAFYSIAQKVAMIVTIPSSILNNIYTQYLSKAYQVDKSNMINVLKKFILLYIFSLTFMFLFLYFLGGFIITTISSQEYLSSYNIMILLVIANIIVIFSSVFTSIFAVLKKTKKISFVWIIVLILYLVLSVILSKQYDIYGAVYAIIISFGLGFFTISYMAYKELKSE